MPVAPPNAPSMPRPPTRSDDYRPLKYRDSSVPGAPPTPIVSPPPPPRVSTQPLYPVNGAPAAPPLPRRHRWYVLQWCLSSRQTTFLCPNGTHRASFITARDCHSSVHRVIKCSRQMSSFSRLILFNRADIRPFFNQPIQPGIGVHPNLGLSQWKSCTPFSR